MQKGKGTMRPPPRFAWSDLDRRPAETGGGALLTEADLTPLIRQIERWRHRHVPPGRADLGSFGRMAMASLRMDGLQIEESDVVEALLKGGVRGDLRSRRAQFIRNHVAIQLRIERCIRNAAPLRPSDVLTWYALLCSGRPATGIDAAGLARLEQVCRQVNSPPMQLQAAIADIATLHCHMLRDPLVPSFNGILARLILRYHLGRCALPRITLGTDAAGFDGLDPRRLYARLVTLLQQGVIQPGPGHRR